MSKVKLYFYNVLVVIDMLGCSLLGGFAGETISGRCGRARAHGLRFGTFCACVIDGVFYWLFNDKDHCNSAIVSDLRGRHEEAVPVE